MPSMELPRNVIAFNGPPSMESTKVSDIETTWIRGRLIEVPDNQEETEIDTIKARIEILGTGVPPDHAFANVDAYVFIALDLEKNFLPFGKEPRIDQMFYIVPKKYLLNQILR